MPNLVKYGIRLFTNNLIEPLTFALNEPLCLPVNIFLEASPVCNLRCQQCFIWKNKKAEFISYQKAKKVIIRLRKWLGEYNLGFTGGEPFLNPNLLNIIRFAHDVGIMTHLNTNGTLIERKLARAIVLSGLGHITISLDFPDGNQHDLNRGVKGTFMRATSAISYLQEYRKSLGKENPRIFINSIIMGKNIDEIEQLIQLAKDLKTDGISFQPIISVRSTKYRKDWYKNSNLWPQNYPDVEKSLDKLESLKRLSPLFIRNSHSDFLQYKKYFQNPGSTLRTIRCRSGFRNFIIDSYGNIKICFNYPPLANIFTDNESLSTIWKNEKAKKQRKMIRRCQLDCKLIPCNRKKDFMGSLYAFFAEVIPHK